MIKSKLGGYMMRSLKRGRRVKLGLLEMLILSIAGYRDGRYGLPKEDEEGEWTSPRIQKEMNACNESHRKIYETMQIRLERNENEKGIYIRSDINADFNGFVYDRVYKRSGGTDRDQARANAVKNSLIDFGISEERIVALGWGNQDKWHLGGVGTSGELAAQNRKVVLLDGNTEEAMEIISAIFK